MHWITLAAVWATAAPAIASAATVAPTNSMANFLLIPCSSSALFLDVSVIYYSCGQGAAVSQILVVLDTILLSF